jgi:hypothetical protein
MLDPVTYTVLDSDRRALGQAEAAHPVLALYIIAASALGHYTPVPCAASENFEYVVVGPDGAENYFVKVDSALVLF